MKHIYKNIREIRKSKGLTQLDVCEKLGIPQSNYAKLEKGITAMTVERLQQVADALGMSVVDIINYPNVGAVSVDSEKVKELEKMYLEKLEKTEKMQTVNIQLVLAFYDLRDFFIKAQNENKDINESYNIALTVLNKYIELFKTLLGLEEVKN